MPPVLALAAGLLLALAGDAVAANPCGPESDCEIAGGSYRAVAPPGWDGRAPLPTVVFFHGYQATGADMLADTRIAAPLAAAGYLLIAPNGRDKTWSHQGSPSQERDEHAFVDAVLADAGRSWPIDGKRLIAAGFSQGGSMVWDLACLSPGRFRAFVAIAGSFWDPLPTSCREPVSLLHIHGFDDEMVPLEGRPIGGSFHQGDLFAGMDLVRRTAGCGRKPQATKTEGGLTCRAWTDCRSGSHEALCFFQGGHEVPTGWVGTMERWLADGIP